MPNYKGHLLGGVIFFIGFNIFNFSKIFFPDQSLIIKLGELALFLIGSLAPDVDIHSKGRVLLDGFLLLIFLCSCVVKNSLGIVLCFTAFVFVRLVGHRKITHNPFFIVLAPYCLMGIIKKYFHFCPDVGANFYYSFVFGAFSHLFLDFIPKRYLPGIFFSIDKYQGWPFLTKRKASR